MSWTAILVLGLGTWVLKAVGPLLIGGRELPKELTRVAALLPPALLAALVASQAVGGAGGIALDARLAGMAAAGVAVWRRAPFIVVLGAGMLVTAAVRALTPA